MIEIQDWWKKLDGMSLGDAQALARSKGWSIRVIMEDTEPAMFTAEYRTDRLNVRLVKGKVKAKPYKVG